MEKENLELSNITKIKKDSEEINELNIKNLKLEIQKFKKIIESNEELKLKIIEYEKKLCQQKSDHFNQIKLIEENYNNDFEKYKKKRIKKEKENYVNLILNKY